MSGALLPIGLAGLAGVPSRPPPHTIFGLGQFSPNAKLSNSGVL